MNEMSILELLEKSRIAEPDKRKKYVLEERGKKWVGNNVFGKTGFVFQIDEGLIKTVESKKCDKGLFLDTKEVYLVELKGVDFNTAYKQLKVTLDFLKAQGGSCTYYCRVVVKELPSKSNYPYSYRALLASLPKDKKFFGVRSGVLEENV